MRDVGLVGGSVSGQLDVGGLAGASIEGTIVQSYASGAVSASQDYAGGLVGHNFYATIIRSYATGSVTGYVAGGLVGENFSLSTIIESYATGAVTGGLVGGLVGDNYGGTISRSYATGPVTGSDAGGLVTINSGVTTDSYWDTQTSGQPSSAGGTGLTTAQLQNGAATGLGAAFSGGTGGLYPYLTNFFPNGVQAVSGTALTSGGTATSGAQLGVYSGGTLLTGVTTSAGANGYFYEIVAAGTLAGNAKFGAMLTLAGAGSVSGLLFTDAATSSGSVFALGRLNDGLNRQITADTTYSALQTDLGATFGTTRYATLATTLNATPTSITATAASFTLDQAVKVAADFSLSTTGTNAPLTLNANLSAARQTVTLTSTGSIGQNGGTITADTLTGSSVGDAFFTEAGNNIGALGTFSTTGGFALIDAASLSVSGAVKAAGTALISTTSGNLDITTGSVTSSAIGDAVTLATSGDFTNGVGASAVQAANGRWLIYSANPAGDTFAGLDSGNTAIWGTAAGATVSASGNRYVFALTPTLTVTSTNDSKVYGTDDGAAIAADYTVLGVQSGVTGAYLGDTAATAYSGAATVSSAGSAANSHVVAGGYAYTLGLGTLTSASGYSFTLANTGKLTVTPAALTITADNQSKVYGAALPTLTASYAGLVNGDTAASLTTGPMLTTTATAASHVAGNPYSITASGAVDSDYAISYVGGSLSVTTAALTITANNQSKVYGAALPTLTASYTGLVNGDTAASLTTGPTLTTTATAASHVGAGPYAITASGAVDSDYAISYVGGSLSVTTAPLTITANNQSKVYGAALPGLTASINGFVNGDTAASLTTGPTLTTTATAASHVAGGPYAITASGAVNSDYKISYVAGTLAVTAAALTITADSKTMTYRDALPALTATYSGFVNGDGTGSLTTAPVLASATPATANAGTYNGTLTARGAVDGDYAISFAAGNLVIGQRAITVTADPQSRVQSHPNPLLTFQVGGRGLITGDTLSGGLATSATTQSVVGIYAITQGTLAASSNYMLSYIGADLTVTSVPSTVVNPVTVAGSQFQPPANASISLVTPPVAPAPLLAFTRSAPITNAAGDKKNTDVVTSSVDVFAPSADGLVYPPISQYDPGQYAGDKLPDHVEQAGLATILTMIARAAAHEITPPVTPPTIDQLFDPAKGADWHGVGWQNPLVDKVNFAADPQGSEPGFATALPLDGKTDIGALLGHGPVILAGANDTWLLAVAITEGGIVADDPVTGTRVLLAYDPVTKTIGSIGKIFDSAGNKWIARGDAGKAGIEFVDDAKLAALQTFETEKYLTVTLVK